MRRKKKVDPEPVTFMTPDEFREIRLRSNLSQEALAPVLGMRLNSVGAMERGQRPIRKLVADKMRELDREGVAS